MSVDNISCCIPSADGGLLQYGSVQQVVSYLKKEYLIDPLSYQPIEWSPVQQVNDGYWVRHQYRARNSFGGYVVMDQVFHLNMDGKVDRVQDYIK